MHKITSLELLRHNSVFSATKQMYENARPQMLKSFFLSEKKLLNAILRVKLNYMKNVSFSWNEMFFAMAEDRFSSCWAFLQKKIILELKLHKITSLELLKNTNSVFSATKQMMRMRGHRCSKASFSERKSC